jgi:uncharacterized membrane protein
MFHRIVSVRTTEVDVKDGDISLYATAVIAKDSTGGIHVKQSADSGPIGTAVGLFTGSMVGLLAGPVGMAIGAAAGLG